MSNTTNCTEEELTAGQMLGRYELLMPLAKGGMGNVWAARLKGTRGFRKLVAIKTILRTLEHAGLEQMLYQEAVLASQIHHPNVAETLELGEQEGTLYLVMELVAGESLRYVMHEAQARGGIPMNVCINVIGQVCRGLAAAHDLRDAKGECVGLIHRDISPPNVMITDAGTVKIVDFGVATTASSGRDATGEIKGKISYVSPEQLQGLELDARVDVFATGILLYLLTVGCHPFRTSSEASTIARILSSAPATTPSALVEDYPDALEQIVMRALHKDRQERFQSITGMLEALENAFPSAFGPRADEAAAIYFQRLMKERLMERKTILRVAEELAERSSPRHSAYSLPVVMASAPPPAKSHRSAWVGLGGLITGLGVAALAGTLYLQGLRPTTVTSAASFAPAEAPVVLPLRASAASALPIGTSATAAGALGSASAAPPVAPSPSSAPRSKRASEHAASDEPAIAEAIAPSAALEPPPAASAVADQGEVAAALPDLAQRPLAPEPSAAPQALAPAALVPTPPKAAPTAPRLLSSRLGQNQLLTNPSSDPARVRLPAGLARMGESFSAVVNVCVTSAGNVSKVTILRSAGPALDPQIPSALSRWRYRPLVEDGQATPFCYVLNYEIGAR